MCIFKPGLRKFRSRPSESTLSTKASLLFHLDLIKTPLLVPNYKKLDLFQQQVPLLPPFTASLTPVKQ